MLVKTKRTLSLLLVITLVTIAFAGCGQSGTSNAPTDTPSNVQANDSGNTSNDARDSGTDASADPVELTIWAPLHWVGAVMNWNDSVAWQEIQKKTGVKLTFEHPPSDQAQENFNLLIASGTLPDIISTDWTGDNLYIGGGDKYINEGYILRLNELAEQYSPDYLRCIRDFVPQNEQKEFYTDEGNMMVYYAISPYEEWNYIGLLYRQDWMEELGLDNPETFDEIENVLTRFKNEKGASNPFIFPSKPRAGIDWDNGMFLTAWDVGPSFYQKDNVVKYGPVQPEFKEYLALMSGWYAKGLIDRDFATRDDEARKRMITTGESGVIINSPDTVGDWMTGISTMIAGNYPVRKQGDKIEYRLKNYAARTPFSFAITTACKHPEEAAKFLNFGYTEEGWMIYNYGIEGEVYNKTGETFTINGHSFDKIKYTDTMMDNPPLSILDTIAKYKVHIGPFLRFEHEGNPTVNWNTAAMRQFMTDAAGTTLNMPMVSMNSDEGQEYARIMNQINTYQDTAVLEFIMGIRSLDTFEAYIADMEKLEINKALQIQQAALDRYNKR